jgi:plastocyanin
MAGLASNIPGLIWVSENKVIVFTIAGLLLSGNGLLLWFNRNAPCPIDPKLRDACIKGRKMSKKMYFISGGVFVVGTFFAFVAPALAKDSPKTQSVKIEVTEKGFLPSEINVLPGTDVTLEVTRKTDTTCSTEIQVPSKKIKKALPLNQPVSIALGKLDKGEIRFGCGMNMMDSGRVVVR